MVKSRILYIAVRICILLPGFIDTSCCIPLPRLCIPLPEFINTSCSIPLRRLCIPLPGFINTSCCFNLRRLYIPLSGFINTSCGIIKNVSSSTSQKKFRLYVRLYVFTSENLRKFFLTLSFMNQL